LTDPLPNNALRGYTPTIAIKVPANKFNIFDRNFFHVEPLAETKNFGLKNYFTRKRIDRQ
jgi:hypothetical protein